MLGLVGLPGSAVRLRAAMLLLREGAERRLVEGSIRDSVRGLRSVAAAVAAVAVAASAGVRSF